jgi:conjugal transfer pilus assembly protein TrbC
MARSGAQIGSNAASTPAASPVRIFITLEMPRASLQLLIDQAARSGAVLVLRGLKANSLRETLSAVSGLIGERQVAWVIDPEAFTRYGVEHAPTFVLTLTGPSEHDAPGTNCGTDCPTSAAFASVSGDVSLDYALETLLKHRPDAAALVTPILKRLRGS